MEEVPELTVFKSGLESGPPLLFVHGWPDDESLFRAQTLHFSTTHHIHSIRLPWFSTHSNAESDASTRGYSPWGYDFDVLAASLLGAARSAGATAATPVTVIAHDWGSFVTQIAEMMAPELFSRVVLLDVGLLRWVVAGPTGQRKEVVGMTVLTMLYMG